MYEGKITKALKREFCSVADCMRECEKKVIIDSEWQSGQRG